MLSAAPAAASDPAISCRRVNVSFGALRALDDVSLDLEPGRIHALVGQNGAGKTTLARVLVGLVVPDSGRMRIAGGEIRAGDVRATKAAGVAIVHQHFSMPPSFTVAEALELTAVKPGTRSFYRRPALEERWREDIAAAITAGSPSTRVRDLPIEARQSLEIARALAGDVRVLVLDEPTALLTPAAIDALFVRLRRLRETGVTVLVVLHKLAEVAAVADTVSVLRDGRLVLGPIEIGEVAQGEISDAIVGAAHIDESPGMPGGGQAPATGSIRLELDGITTTGSTVEQGLRDVRLQVKAGEIVGVAGVEGNGQRGLVSAVAGLTPLATGTVRIGGRDVTADGPARRRRLGLRLVPFDRSTEGISRTAPLWLNQSVLRIVNPTGRVAPLISLRRFRAKAEEAMDRWGVRYQSVAHPASTLSGGNVQRLILSRELDGDVDVLVAAQPTRGLDFAATGFVRATLRRLRKSGAGVLLISSDLEELFELSDRLVVMLGGRIVAGFEAPYDRRSVGDAMTGATR